jgi:hypothetical protein
MVLQLAKEVAMKKKISIGDTFGSLVAVEKFDTDKGMVVWHCRCECGQSALVRSDRLRNGERTHCGCRGQEHVWSTKCLRHAT